MAPGANVTAFAVRRGLSRDGRRDIGGRFRGACTPAVERQKPPFLMGTRPFIFVKGCVPFTSPGSRSGEPVSPPLDAMRGWLAMLEQGLAREDRSAIFGVLRDAVPDFFGGEAA